MLCKILSRGFILYACLGFLGTAGASEFKKTDSKQRLLAAAAGSSKLVETKAVRSSDSRLLVYFSLDTIPEELWKIILNYAPEVVLSALFPITLQLHHSEYFPHKVSAIKFNADGTRLAIFSNELRKIKIVDFTQMASNQKNSSNMRELDPKTSHCVMAFNPKDACELITVGVDEKFSKDRNQVCIWNIETGNIKKEFVINGSLIHSASYHPDGQQVIFSHGNTVKVYNTASGCKSVELQAPEDISFAQTNHDGSQLVAGRDFTNDVYVWNLARKDAMPTVIDTGSSVTKVAFDSETGQLITASMNDFSYWGVHSNNLVRQVNHSVNKLVVFNPHNTGYAIANSSNSMDIIPEVISTEVPGQKLLVLEGNINGGIGIQRLAVNPQGSEIISIAENKKVCIWKIGDLIPYFNGSIDRKQFGLLLLLHCRAPRPLLLRDIEQLTHIPVSELATILKSFPKEIRNKLIYEFHIDDAFSVMRQLDTDSCCSCCALQ